MSIDERPPFLDEPPYDPPYDDGYQPEPAATTPAGLDAEQHVLGAMINNPTVITEVTNTITGADYAQPRHETIHDAITTLHTTGRPVDLVTVAAELLNNGNLQRAGGAPYLLVGHSAGAYLAARSANSLRGSSAARCAAPSALASSRATTATAPRFTASPIRSG